MCQPWQHCLLSPRACSLSIPARALARRPCEQQSQPPCPECAPQCAHTDHAAHCSSTNTWMCNNEWGAAPLMLFMRPPLRSALIANTKPTSCWPHRWARTARGHRMASLWTARFSCTRQACCPPLCCKGVHLKAAILICRQLPSPLHVLCSTQQLDERAVPRRPDLGPRST